MKQLNDDWKDIQLQRSILWEEAKGKLRAIAAAGHFIQFRSDAFAEPEYQEAAEAACMKEAQECDLMIEKFIEDFGDKPFLDWSE